MGAASSTTEVDSVVVSALAAEVLTIEPSAADAVCRVELVVVRVGVRVLLSDATAVSVVAAAVARAVVCVASSIAITSPLIVEPTADPPSVSPPVVIVYICVLW